MSHFGQLTLLTLMFGTAAPPEEQARLLEEALGVVRAHAASMRRCIDKLQILDSLKHASMMLGELRSSALGPKHYYELCTYASPVIVPGLTIVYTDMAVFDSLRFLSTYIKEAHVTGKQHCADLYEIVQYAGNIVPRLYLMITVGRFFSFDWDD
jgi:vacuolar protein sorting-associated protein 35